MKNQNLHIRIGPEDAERLALLVDHYEMSGAQVIRMLIKREAATLSKRRPNR